MRTGWVCWVVRGRFAPGYRIAVRARNEPGPDGPVPWSLSDADRSARQTPAPCFSRVLRQNRISPRIKSGAGILSDTLALCWTHLFCEEGVLSAVIDLEPAPAPGRFHPDKEPPANRHQRKGAAKLVHGSDAQVGCQRSVDLTLASRPPSWGRRARVRSTDRWY